MGWFDKLVTVGPIFCAQKGKTHIVAVQKLRMKNHGPEWMRQKLLVDGAGVLVNISTPLVSAELVSCGTQLAVPD